MIANIEIKTSVLTDQMEIEELSYELTTDLFPKRYAKGDILLIDTDLLKKYNLPKEQIAVRIYDVFDSLEPDGQELFIYAKIVG